MVISHFPEKNLAVCVFCYLFRQISGDNAYYQRINYSLKKYCHESITFQAKKKQRTIARTELQDVVKSVRDCVYSSAVCQLREVYMFSRRMDDGSIETDFRLDEKVPRACFAADMKV